MNLLELCLKFMLFMQAVLYCNLQQFAHRLQLLLTPGELVCSEALPLLAVLQRSCQ